MRVNYGASYAALPPLTAEEQGGLIALVKGGGPESDRAREALSLSMSKQVYSIARRYYISLRDHVNVDIKDFVSEGQVGVARAIKGYDPAAANGASFSTYAYQWIDSMIRAFARRERFRGVHVNARVAAVASRYATGGGEYPATPDRVSEVCGVGPDEAEDVALAVAAGGVCANLGTFGGEDKWGSSKAYEPADPNSLLWQEHIFLREEVDKLMGHLSLREREVLSMRFGLGGRDPMSLSEVADAMTDVGKERVRQIEAKAIRRAALAAAGRAGRAG